MDVSRDAAKSMKNERNKRLHHNNYACSCHLYFLPSLVPQVVPLLEELCVCVYTYIIMFVSAVNL